MKEVSKTITYKQITKGELELRGIFKRYQNITFNEIERIGVPKQVINEYKTIKKYSSEILKNIEEGNGLILKGKVGTMKSTFAIAILREYINKHDGSGLFVSMTSMLDNLFSMKAKNKEEFERYEDKLRKTKLLILDDLGSEYHQEWVLSKVDSIITDRYNKMLPIIVTTNLSASELKGKYAERIIDRLRSTSLQINFDGESLR